MLSFEPPPNIKGTHCRCDGWNKCFPHEQAANNIWNYYVNRAINCALTEIPRSEQNKWVEFLEGKLIK